MSSGLTRALRVEAFGAFALPSTLDQYEGFDESLGLRQEENFAFAGGLLEWSARPDLRLGAFGTWVRAETERTALSDSVAVDEYRLLEETTNVGAYGLWVLDGTWHLEGLVARNRRPEERVYRNGEQPDVDYLDHSWTGYLVARHTAAMGLLADLGFYFDLRDVVRGDRQVQPSSVGLHSTRLTGMIGWRFNEHLMFLIGAGLELDGDGGDTNRFDGVKARFTAVW